MDETPQIALITGASRGIGLAVLKKLVSMGITCIGTATTQDGVNMIEKVFFSQEAQGYGLMLNLSDAQSIEQAWFEIQERNQIPSIVIHNAAINRDDLMIRMDDEKWDDVIQTNLTSVFRLTKKVVRPMLKAHFGRIIFLGSVVSEMGNPGQANYGAAKAGIEGFCRTLAREVATRGITANVVSPGFIETDMTHHMNDAWKEKLLGQIPLGRAGKPEEVASLIAFLCSKEAGYITGQTIRINGGMWM